MSRADAMPITNSRAPISAYAMYCIRSCASNVSHIVE
jgi:hypothetical protein